MEDIFVSYEEQIEKYEKQFVVAEGQVGFIAVIGNKIAGMDIFGSRLVMPKIFRKLLRGYILDALDQKAADAAQKAEGSAQAKGEKLANEAAEFLRRVTSARKETYKSVGSGDELRFGNRFTNGFALVNNDEVVHMAAFAE
jgi:hypothetical protein